MMTDIPINQSNMRTVRLHLLADHTYAQSDPDHLHSLLWATDSYPEHAPSDEMTENAYHEITPRYIKQKKLQEERTKKKAEVFTPVWLCNHMINQLDNAYFTTSDVFNHENLSDHTWTDTYQYREHNSTERDKYIQSRRLEITCGEAPFLVSRYDSSTGDTIPLSHRIGLLDRKLQWINDTVNTYDEWEKLVIIAYQATYGYEYQGDNLLIARLNLLNTYHDYYNAQWNKDPSTKEYETISRIISWNLWQMDGQPDDSFDTLDANSYQGSLFDDDFDDFFDTSRDKATEETRCPQRASHCSIRLWKNLDLKEDIILFSHCYERKIQMTQKQLFDYVIGNPPYNEDFNNFGDNDSYARPIYHHFMDAAISVGRQTELITPARFLFDAGSTPKQWNHRMLNDPHFRVVNYYAHSADVFPTTDIRGGGMYFSL